jgi:hypothetical protein
MKRERKQIKIQEDDAEQPHTGTKSQGSKQKPTSEKSTGASSGSAPSVPPPGESSTPVPGPERLGANWRHKRVGVVSLLKAKRKTTCVICSGELIRDDFRFTVVPKLNLSEKSCHPYCVAGISQLGPGLVETSKEWLEQEISSACPESIECDMMREALRALNSV